jgi:hypothetical protein
MFNGSHQINDYFLSIDRIELSHPSAFSQASKLSIDSVTQRGYLSFSVSAAMYRSSEE